MISKDIRGLWKEREEKKTRKASAYTSLIKSAKESPPLSFQAPRHRAGVETLMGLVPTASERFKLND